MKKILSIRNTPASIKIKDERRVEWNFLNTDAACNAIVLILREAIKEQISMLGNVYEEFTVEMTVKPNK